MHVPLSIFCKKVCKIADVHLMAYGSSGCPYSPNCRESLSSRQPSFRCYVFSETCRTEGGNPPHTYSAA